MNITETSLKGVYLCEPAVFGEKLLVVLFLWHSDNGISGNRDLLCLQIFTDNDRLLDFAVRYLRYSA